MEKELDLFVIYNAVHDIIDFRGSRDALLGKRNTTRTKTMHEMLKKK